ncbi:unnamed protein product [Withania somnifera]
MGIQNRQALALLLVALLSFAIFHLNNAQDSTRLVAAIITFGDSASDVGNNDYILTLFKANYPPYGRDFVTHQPTGRFCNGKLVTDITADTLGFTTYPAAYLSPQASGKNLLIGTNFASAAAGYDDVTSILNHAIPLSTQMQYFKEYQSKLAKVAGRQKAAFIVKDALYILSAGTADFLQNYYFNPYLNKNYTTHQYSSHLVRTFTCFVKDLYGQGARRIGVTSLPPLGCLPAAKALFGFHKSGCISKINRDAQHFNKKMNSAATKLRKQLPGLKIAIFDVFQPIYELVKSPTDHGFVVANHGCCGTGRMETTSLFCNPNLAGSCSNATEYVFWDGVHLTETANQVLADALIVQGINLLG